MKNDKKNSAERPSWPADQVERWPVEDLVPYANNSRIHSPEQVAKIAASIRQFGFTMPVLAAEDGTIVAGHGRVLAAQELGLEEVPVVVARGWSDEQRRAYTIADNQLTLDGEWDEDLLRIELGDLSAADFDLSLTGFNEKELASWLGGWDSDIEAVRAAGEHTEGIKKAIKVTVAQADAEEAERVIRDALEAAGIEFEA